MSRLINSLDVTDFENSMSLENPIKSTIETRWERKAAAEREKKSLNDSSNFDRFIPNRSSTDYEAPSQLDNSTSSEHAKLLESEVGNSRVLAFKTKAPAPVEGYQNSMRVLYSQQGAKHVVDPTKSFRHISSTPARILDAPGLMDDYYLNLLSWSATNTLAVGLDKAVYLWDASTGSISELMNVDSDPSDYICSVSWLPQGGSHLAIGTASNTVQLWDAQAGRKIRTLNGHAGRVGALSWNKHLLSSGSQDTTVLNHDVRVQHHIVGVLRGHSQEVCGLSWSMDGSYLASGGNDNTLCIYDQATTITPSSTPPSIPLQDRESGVARHVLTEHQAAVKALAWSPHERNLLASGGGTADRCIKFWNASSGAMLNSVDTGSQVCALQWSPYEKGELLSSHGYAENQLCLWKYPTMTRVKELKGHTSRVLHLASAPAEGGGGLVCSAAADETLRFWNIFAMNTPSDRKGVKEGGIGGIGGVEGGPVMEMSRGRIR